MSYFHKATGF